MDLFTNLAAHAPRTKPTTWSKELLVCVLLSVTFGIFACLASDKILNRQNQRSESIEMERAILKGQPIDHSGELVYVPAWQNRVLFPALLELVRHLPVLTIEGWYVLLRLLFGIAMFATFWLVLRMDAQAEFRLAGAGLLLLAYSLVFTFYSPAVMTSDFPDVIFIAMFIAVSLRHKRLLLLVLSVIAAANRESSAFAGVIWFFLYGVDKVRRINWRETGYAALLTICSYATVILIRYAFGGGQATQYNTQLLPINRLPRLLMDLFQHPSAFSWLGIILFMLAPGVIWIVSNRKYLTSTHIRLLGAACAITAISVVFGNPGEPRIFIPTIVITIFVAVSAEASRQAFLIDQVIRKVITESRIEDRATADRSDLGNNSAMQND